MSHYDTLGVSKDATPDEIRKAYRRAASEHHPNREGGDGEKMATVNRAFEVLCDPEKRARYDQTGSDSGGAAMTPEAQAHRIVIDRLRAHVLSAINPVLSAKRDVTEEIRRLQSAVKSARKDREKLLARRKRVRGGDDNPLLQVIDGLMAEADAAIKTGEDNVSMLEIAVKMLGGVGYEEEPPAPKPKGATDKFATMEVDLNSIVNDFSGRGLGGFGRRPW